MSVTEFFALPSLCRRASAPLSLCFYSSELQQHHQPPATAQRRVLCSLATPVRATT
ncbi:hypothetical protein JCGZ_06906 [Jatropha curcas]|uniref:Uncharacterized protein n=1 Tax=Jatropha curcas TaxID=180498 RepID=A0A067KMJ6_JATCU|nr:hypothetical protein JCGZ_06906 [Jatropha curcas]